MPDGISPFDIALGLPLLWAAIRGIRKGLIMEVTGLAALFLGAWAALFCSDLAAAYLDEHFAIGHAYMGITSFAVTFLGVVVGVHLLGRVVEKMVDLTALKPMGRLGGLAFAIGRAWLFWSIVILLIQGALGTEFLPSSWIEGSHLWPAMGDTARFLLPIIDPWIPEI